MSAPSGAARRPPRLALRPEEAARPPRLALRPEEAAEAIGVSRSFFFETILPELRVVRRGRLRLVPVRELEQWLERSAARALE